MSNWGNESIVGAEPFNIWVLKLEIPGQLPNGGKSMKGRSELKVEPYVRMGDEESFWTHFWGVWGGQKEPSHMQEGGYHMRAKPRKPVTALSLLGPSVGLIWQGIETIWTHSLSNSINWSSSFASILTLVHFSVVLKCPDCLYSHSNTDGNICIRCL